MTAPVPDPPEVADPPGVVADPPVAPDPPLLPDAAVLALLVVDGILLGGIGLVFTPLYAGGVAVPMGALLSILILPWLVARAGELDPRPAVAGAPLTAWFLTIGVLGLAGPGGDVLLPATWPTLLLVLGGLAAGLLALRRILDRTYLERARG